MLLEDLHILRCGLVRVVGWRHGTPPVESVEIVDVASNSVDVFQRVLHLPMNALVQDFQIGFSLAWAGFATGLPRSLELCQDLI